MAEPNKKQITLEDVVRKLDTVNERLTVQAEILSLQRARLDSLASDVSYLKQITTDMSREISYIKSIVDRTFVHIDKF